MKPLLLIFQSSNNTLVYEIVSSAPEERDCFKIKQFYGILSKHQPNANFF